MIDHVEIEDALDRAALDRVRGAMLAAAGDPATVSGLADERAISGARRATAIDVPEATRAEMAALLDRLRPRLAGHFGRPLDSCEEAQFLRYVEGDYFVAHQDGNTPLLHDDTRFRKVSVVLFVNDGYSGGELMLHEGYGPSETSVAVTPRPGTLVAYPSETTHEVLPVSAGERLTIVSWYRSDR